MKNEISIENCVLKYEEKEIPLISGEFHYWRVFIENWDKIIQKVSELGLNVISSYIPWNYHEISPKKYDFTGETSPQKNLLKFIETCQRYDMYLILRPGPYIYSEWEFGGVPERASQHDRLSEEFLTMSKDYIYAVSSVIKPYQITKGGNIILVQADNEPYPPIESRGTQMGGFGEDGYFKDWLRKRYDDDIQSLNKRWKTSLKSFDQACIYFHEAYVDENLEMGERLLNHKDVYARYQDTHDFIGDYANQIVGRVKDWLVDAGIDVPIYANGWSPLFQDFKKFMDIVQLAGSDIYPYPFFETSQGTNDHWLYNLDIIKQQEADVTNGNVWSAEFQSGIYPITAGYLKPEHFSHVCFSLMAKGLKGWNWYMLVNRDNWVNSPINEWGRPNEYFSEFRNIVEITKAVEPWKTNELCDLSLMVYKPHRVIDPGNFLKVFDVLEKSDLSFSYFKFNDQKAPKSQILLYSGSSWLENDIAKEILQFIEEGGTFISFSSYPREDSNGMKLKKLSFIDPLGARPVHCPINISYMGYQTILKDVGHLGSKINLFYYDDIKNVVPIEAQLSIQAKETLVDIGSVNSERFTIGYKKYIGKGQLILIGANPSKDLLELVLQGESILPYAKSSLSQVRTTLFKHDDGHLILYVINFSDEALKASVRLNTSRLSYRKGQRFKIRRLDSNIEEIIDNNYLQDLVVTLLAKEVAIYKIFPF